MTTAVRALILPALLVGIVGSPITVGSSLQRVRCGTRTSAPCTAPGELTLQNISAGYAHSCGVSNEGRVYCWGDGRQGALATQAKFSDGTMVGRRCRARSVK